MPFQLATNGIKNYSPQSSKKKHLHNKTHLVYALIATRAHTKREREAESNDEKVKQQKLINNFMATKQQIWIVTLFLKVISGVASKRNVIIVICNVSFYKVYYYWNWNK